MKIKWTALILAVLLVFVTASMCFAGDTVKVYVNGKEIQNDVPAHIINGSTMLPVRAIAEAMDAEVEWDQNTRKVFINSRKDTSKGLVKLNGEITTWPYWYEEGVLYLEYRNAVQFVRECYSHPNYIVSYYKESQTMVVNNKRVELRAKKKGDYTIVPLNPLKMRGLVDYDWDEETGNIIIKK